MLVAWIAMGAVMVFFLVLYLFVGNYTLVGKNNIRHALVCPCSGETTDVELQCTGGVRNKDTPMCVEWCSAFDDPCQVDCDQECIQDCAFRTRFERKAKKSLLQRIG